MADWLSDGGFIFLGLGVLVVGIALSDTTLRTLRAKRNAAKLRRRLHPVASTLNVVISEKEYDGSCGLYYTFPGGATVSLVVSEAGFNCHPPIQSGAFIDSAGVSLLLSAIETERHTEPKTGVRQ